ncbi:MAG: hypothetical protein LBJ32_03690 [Oscillospiraceae bacterium]|nr:hypothetical protein [Oscillospiraceae bacterium]
MSIILWEISVSNKPGDRYGLNFSQNVEASKTAKEKIVLVNPWEIPEVWEALDEFNKALVNSSDFKRIFDRLPISYRECFVVQQQVDHPYRFFYERK